MDIGSIEGGIHETTRESTKSLSPCTPEASDIYWGLTLGLPIYGEYRLLDAGIESGGDLERAELCYCFVESFYFYDHTSIRVRSTFVVARVMP